VSIAGTVETGLERVRDAFTGAFQDERMGAALSIWLDGRPIVDLWGGLADPRTGRPWDQDTASVIFSCTKGLMSILAAQLIESGRLDPDAPVSCYWPEFGSNGKESTTVRHLLAHRAGLSAPHQAATSDDIVDWSRMIARLEAETPLWPPGEGYAYHAITYGWLVGEVLRRVTGLPVGKLFEQAVARPLRAEAWIGLPEAEFARVAHLTTGKTLVDQTAAAATARPPGAIDWNERALTLGGALPLTLATPDGGFNSPNLWRAEIPGAGGIASARGLGKIWSATVRATDGVRLLGNDTIERVTRVETDGPPMFEVPPPWPRWGMGFQLDSETRRYLTPTGFGHDGAGGQVGFAEPGLGIGFGFVTNLMEGSGDPRATAIIDALRDCLGEPRILPV